MGGGSWTRSAFSNYVATSYCASVSADGSISTALSNQEIFKSKKVNKALIAYNAMRECKDTEEHPNTVPVILALDVTGSMGDTAVEVAKKLNVIMTNLYDKVKDIEFMVMGIGDFGCDSSPIQAGQFESDIRIAEQLDKIYFEFGGGGNNYESYSSAWLFGARHTNLDCWKRGKKGLIITMGDERMNPYIPNAKEFLGDGYQGDIETDDLYKEAYEKFDIHHIHVVHRSYVDSGIKPSWALIGDGYHEASMNDISDVITDIILKHADENSDEVVHVSNEGISW